MAINGLINNYYEQLLTVLVKRNSHEVVFRREKTSGFKFLFLIHPNFYFYAVTEIMWNDILQSYFKVKIKISNIYE